VSCCGGRKIRADLARDLITTVPPEALEKEDVDVGKITQIGGSEAIAQAKVNAAFRLEKVKNEWMVREVRIGHAQWEKVDSLLQALETVKIEETQNMLQRVAEAAKKYKESTGKLPAFENYISLSDQLSPQYLTSLIRLDSWRRPLRAASVDDNTIRIWSAGPDGKDGTGDDIARIIAR